MIDAADPDREQQIATTETLLQELDLGRLPRLLVYNKADLLDPADSARLVLGRDDAVLISAVDRESTRALLDRIAAELASRWAESALVPNYEEALFADDAVADTTELYE